MFRANDTLNRLHHAYVYYYCHNCFVFCMEVECGLPLYFRCKSFQMVVDYPPFGHVFEGVDHPPFVKVLIYIFLWPFPFQEKK
jgi:hypothetical protein